jgi:YggT family protein
MIRCDIIRQLTLIILYITVHDGTVNAFPCREINKRPLSSFPSSSSLQMFDVTSFFDVNHNMNNQNKNLIDMDDSTVHSIHSTMEATITSLVIAQQTTEAWVQPLILVLDPFLNFMSFAMLARVVLSWYPEIKFKDAPWSAIVVIPTDSLLRLAKGFVPPAFGVDITPVFWLAIFTFIHEIFLGQQGLLTLKLKYGI